MGALVRLRLLAICALTGAAGVMLLGLDASMLIIMAAIYMAAGEVVVAMRERDG